MSLAMVLVLVAPPPAEAQPSSAAESTRLLNQARADAGLPPLAEHEDLVAAAQAQARSMADAGDLTHNPTLGKGIEGWAKLGENIGRAGSVASTHKALMGSAPHRANILEAAYTHVGVGVVVRDGTVWVAQVFMESAWNGTFWDDDSSVHEADIERLAHSRITRGCDSGKFCPESAVTRGQMAAFIQRAMGLPDGTGNHYADDDASIFEGAIEALAQRGIVEPCGPSRYCPDAPMTREHMAVFLVRALDLPASAVDGFTDDDRSAWEAEIQALSAADITRGCGEARYCPDSSVTRAQMSTFLVRAFGV